ncbi:FAD-binding oxidoreductase [Pseudanabaena sp. FACHB-2040]|uniref:NAD(P)/FAD-dependent oxidoreductase n=1 Tax=Pseudanabaena sp. FACHB-2040 TaxID=2692859 RepID=UPI0016853FB0|nr:FAD-binding oxidoreductase [Pseudanabaena sp. FACHB-2040]MBD2257960.1 FAD-binding oxidoreductase [Pseudanabaena sp. FACHB-2040]
MQTFDWIVVGNGLAGAALSYELTKQGFSVLLLDQALEPSSATRFSYGGIPHWSGTTELTRQLCQEGIVRYGSLSEELEANIELRELDLLLTILAGDDGEGTDPAKILAAYTQFETPPRYITPEEACQIEPQLDPTAIAGALTVRHGHVNPQALVAAYNRAFARLGGTLIIAPVTGLVRIKDRVTGVTTAEQAYAAQQVAIAAGGESRALLQAAGLSVPLYYTQAELIETPPVPFRIQALVMPAETKRFQMEAEASAPETDSLWDEPGHEIAPAILDSGVIQFQDGSLRIGQISRALTAPEPAVDALESERVMRATITQKIPVLKDVPGTWQRCRVPFCRDGLPLVGPVSKMTGLHLFSGFSSPFALLPPIAVRFAQWVSGQPDSLIEQMQPDRFQ